MIICLIIIDIYLLFWAVNVQNVCAFGGLGGCAEQLHLGMFGGLLPL